MRRYFPVLTLAAALGAGGAFAQGEVIKERQNLMDQNGDDMKIVSDMLKGEKPYDAKAAGDAMGRINTSIQRFVTLFPDTTLKPARKHAPSRKFGAIKKTSRIGASKCSKTRRRHRPRPLAARVV